MDYDVKKSLKRIEGELIDSMMRNLSNHLNEEESRDFDWPQWQVEQLKALEQLRRSNPKKYGRRFASINAKMRKAIQEAEAKGQKEEELRILKALTEHKSLGERLSAGDNGVGGEQFFRTNESKLDALLSATQRDMEKAEQAVLRRANDQYRKIIFDAQVYANTGAGTVEKAVDMATKDFLAKGIDSIVYANGARHTISDYADMYIRTAERRAYLMGQGQKRQEWGVSLVIVNRRGTMKDGNFGHACPHCIPWLGKVLVDDVYSGGKPDGIHPRLSEAMAAGFLHPRCKDGFTTYFPGISSAPDPATKQEVAQAVEAEREENREKYAKRQVERFERLEKYSLDPENRQKYAVRAGEWKGNLRELTLNEDREEKLERVPEKRVEKSGSGGILKTIEAESVPVTQKAIDSVPAARVSWWDNEMAERVQAAHRSLLESVKNKKVGVEEARILAMDGTVVKAYPEKFAALEDERVKVPDQPFDYIVIHNHPNCTPFSPADLEKFFLRENLRGMTAIGNNGRIFGVVKSSEYHDVAMENYYVGESVKLTEAENTGDADRYIEILNSILEEAEKNGAELIG